MWLVFEKVLRDIMRQWYTNFAAVMWHNFGPKKLVGKISEKFALFWNLTASSRSKVNTCGWQKKAATQENAIFKPGL